MRAKATINGDEVAITLTAKIGPPTGGPDPPARVPEPEPVDKGKATHSRGFESVNWYGTVYWFTPKQRLVVASLWQAWQEGDGDGAVHQDTLLADADSDQQRLRDLFDRGDHPAWGTMIVAALGKGGQRGCYVLNAPAEYEG